MLIYVIKKKLLCNFFFKMFFQKNVSTVWDMSANRNGWRVRRTK